MILNCSHQTRRVFRAAFIVLALIVSCCVVDDMAPALGNINEVQGEEMVGIDSSKEYLEDPAFRMFSRSGGFDACVYGQVPASFAAEVLDPDSLGLSSVASFGNVVGLVIEGSLTQVSFSIDELLDSKGWMLVDGDASLGNATYVKSGGDIDWLFVSIAEVAGSVSVWIEYR